MVKVDDALAGVRLLFLDTAPVIYLVERNPTYVAIARAMFRFIMRGDVIAVTSPVTLAETLVAPVRAGIPQLQRQYQPQPHRSWRALNSETAPHVRRGAPRSARSCRRLLPRARAVLMNDVVYEPLAILLCHSVPVEATACRRRTRTGLPDGG